MPPTNGHRSGHCRCRPGIGQSPRKSESSADGGSVEFRILGPLELVEDGRPVEVAGAPAADGARALARARERGRLERPPDRRALGGAAACDGAEGASERGLAAAPLAWRRPDRHARAPGYLLRVEPDAIDARRFESLLDQGRQTLASGDTEGAAAILHEALALWRGPPLDEFSYEPFAEAEIARLEELRLRALEERIEADLALGRHADLVGELERLVAEHPLRERPRGQLMLALYRSGRQAEALRTYQDGRRLLAEELGLEPGAALQRLEKQILTQDPALEPPPVVPPLEEARRRPGSERDDAEATTRSSRIRARGDRPRSRGAPRGVPARAGGRASRRRPQFSLSRSTPRPARSSTSSASVPSSNGKTTIVGSYVFLSSDDREILTRIDVRSGEIETSSEASPVPPARRLGPTERSGSAAGTRTMCGRSTPTRSTSSRCSSCPRAQSSPGASPSAAARSGSPRASPVRSRASTPGPGSSSSGIGTRTAVTPPRSRSARERRGPRRTSQSGGELLRVDAAGGGAQLIEIGRIPVAVAVGFGAVWVSDFVQPPETCGEARAREGSPARSGDREPRRRDQRRQAAGRTDDGRRLRLGGKRRRENDLGDRSADERGREHDPHAVLPTSLAYGHGFLWVSLGSDPVGF